MIAHHSATRARGLLTNRLRPCLGLALVMFLVAGAVWLVESGRTGEASDEGATITMGGGLGGPALRIGEAAPNFTLETLEGSTLSLADLRGHPVVINLWATWCPPCRGEMPDLDAVAREQADSGLIVLAVDLREDRASVQRYADTLGLSVTILLDREGTVANRYNLTALPTSYFIDRDGKLADLSIGALTQKGWRSRLVKLLE